MKIRLEHQNTWNRNFVISTFLVLFLMSCNSDNNYQKKLLLCIEEKNKGHFDNAIKCVNAALKYDSSRSFAYLLRGQLNALLKKDSLAIIDYSMALSLDTSNISAYFYLAISFSNLDFQDSAIANFDRALSHKNRDGFVVDFANNENIPLDDQTDIPLSQIHFYRGISYLFSNRLNEAERSFLFTKGTGYEVGWSEYYLGVTYVEKGDIELACIYFQKAISDSCNEANDFLNKYCVDKSN